MRQRTGDWLRSAGLAVAMALFAVAVAALAIATPVATVPLLMVSVAGIVLGAFTAWALFARRIERVTDSLQQDLARSEPALRRRRPNTLGALKQAATDAAAEINGMREAATTDRLTQVSNRSALVSQLLLEVERARRHHHPLAVAFIDVDHFKAVNDTQGHEVGDAVLRGVAAVVRGNIRVTDAVGRYGGEEFLVLMPDTDANGAAEAAEKLRRLVARVPFSVGAGTPVSVTVSIGVAGGQGGELTAEGLVRDADAAMYSAKALGRNQVFVFAVPDDNHRVVRTPTSRDARRLGRDLGRAARAVAEDQLEQTMRALGARAEAGVYVETVAVGIARALALPEEEVDRIRVAARFHDAGMAVVSDAVLDVPRGLLPAEWQLVTQHPRISQVMLEEASRMRDAADIVLHHHERFSGHGYPLGLRGQAIPLGARIVAVADAYEAMREHRPHRPAMTHAQALGEIRRNAGTQFDPDIVETFRMLYAAEPSRTPPAPIQPTAADDQGQADAGRARRTDSRVG